jgi:asparagine synthase (glutamine-hydrolysing)
VLRLDGEDRYERFISCWGDSDIRSLTHGGVMDAPAYVDARQRTARLPRGAQAPILDLFTYLPEDILTKVDRASMRVSLETRCPLLDHRVIEFALGLPLALKWRRGETKWILRRLLERRVPRELFDRPKMGFGVPVGRWLRGALRDRVGRIFGDSSHLEGVGVDAAVARDVWREFLAGREELSSQVWNLFALASWSARWQPQSIADRSLQ